MKNFVNHVNFQDSDTWKMMANRI